MLLLLQRVCSPMRATHAPRRGRYCAWGFLGVAGASSAVVTPPVPGGYIAALRGFEGKPLPKEVGGHKDR